MTPFILGVPGIELSVIQFLGGEGSPVYHIPRHTLGLVQLWPFQKHSAKNMSSQSLPRKTRLEEGEQTGPQGEAIGGQAGAAAKPVRHQVKYGLKTSISISYINTPGPDRKPGWGK